MIQIEEKRETKKINRYFKKSNVIGWTIVKLIFIFQLIVLASHVDAQIKMPGMVQANGTWGVIDANDLYGGCMQFNTRADMLALDVQFLKKGMLLVVYDDNDAVAGNPTQMYMFLPPTAADWDYAKPSDITTGFDDTIDGRGIFPGWFKTVMSGSDLPPATIDLTNKTIVYFDSSDSKLYRYDSGTDSWVEISIGGNSTITDDTATATSVYPTWAKTSSGEQPQYVSSTSLSFVPSTGVLTATGIKGTTVEAETLNTTGAVYAKVRVHSDGSTNVQWADDDYIVLLTGTMASYILALPSPGGTNKYRVLSIRNCTGATIVPVSNPGISWPVGLSNLTGGMGVTVISDGVNWYNFTR